MGASERPVRPRDPKQEQGGQAVQGGDYVRAHLPAYLAVQLDGV